MVVDCPHVGDGRRTDPIVEIAAFHVDLRVRPRRIRVGKCIGESAGVLLGRWCRLRRGGRRGLPAIKAHEPGRRAGGDCETANRDTQDLQRCAHVTHSLAVVVAMPIYANRTDGRT